MNWIRSIWKRREPRPSPEAEQAKIETRQAQQRLRAIEREDVTLNALTARTQRLAIGNNFASDIRKALGGGAR